MDSHRQVTNISLISTLNKKIGKIRYNPIQNWRPNSYTIISPIYNQALEASIFLTKIKGINVSFLYLHNKNTWYYVYFRFSDELYNDTTLIGQLVQNTFVVHAVKLSDISEMRKSMAQFDQSLYNKYTVDKDLESIDIKIAPLSSIEADIKLDSNVIGRYYTNNNQTKPHFKYSSVH